jgi:hypothetical protein
MDLSHREQSLARIEQAARIVEVLSSHPDSEVRGAAYTNAVYLANELSSATDKGILDACYALRVAAYAEEDCDRAALLNSLLKGWEPDRSRHDRW